MADTNVESSTLIKAKALSESNSLNNTLSEALLKPSAKFEKRACSEMSFKDFLNFLHTAYQINEAIKGVPNDLIDKIEIDWQDIAMNEFVSSLLVVKEDSSNPKATLENVKEMTDKEGLKKSLTEQSTSVSDSGECNRLEENTLERTKGIQSDTSSEVSKHNTESEAFRNTLGIKNAKARENIQKGISMNDMDHTTSLVMEEGLSPDLKKTSSSVNTGQQKSKSLMLGKYTENKRKTVSSKKCVLYDCNVKTINEENNKNFEHLMKRKLNEAIQEGLLDSILPYVIPKQASTHPAAKKSSNLDTSKALSSSSLDKSTSDQLSKEKVVINSRRKSTTGE
jgi:hypothetical protein